MDSRLSLTQILLLCGYTLALSGGQLLFKAAAMRSPTAGPLGERLVALLQNGFFLTAVVLYAALTVVWVWILTFTPLSRAYVFLALGFALTPLAAGWLFAEQISGRLVIGVGFIVVGLFCVAG